MKIIGRDRVTVIGRWLAITATILIVVVLTGCFGGATVQKGWSGGTLEGDTLYVGSRDGRLIAVNVADNSREWAVPLETGTTTSGLGCSRSAIVVSMYGSPVVSDNMVYIGGFNGKLYSFIPGENQPDRTLDKVRIGERDITIGPIVGSMVVENNQFYFGSSDGNVYAVNNRLQPIWEQPFSTQGKIWSTPAVKNGTVYVGSYDNKLYAIDAGNGTGKWEFTSEGAFVATPVVEGNTVYAGSFDKHLYAIDTSNGNLRWSFEGKHGFWAKPVVHNDLVYAPCLDGKVYIIRTTDGYKVAEINVQAPVSSSPVLIGNQLVVVTEESKGAGSVKKGAAIWVIDTLENQGSEIVRLTGEKVYAPLAADEDSVFVHTNRDSLFGIDIITGSIRQFTIK